MGGLRTQRYGEWAQILAVFQLTVNVSVAQKLLILTRSYAALRAVDCIVGPGYSSGGYILGCSQCLASCLRHSAWIGPDLLCNPSSVTHRGSQLTREGAWGRNKQKHHRHFFITHGGSQLMGQWGGAGQKRFRHSRGSQLTFWMFRFSDFLIQNHSLYYFLTFTDLLRK